MATLGQWWSCTRCGMTHFEFTDHRVCADRAACDKRVKENETNRTDKYIGEYNA